MTSPQQFLDLIHGPNADIYFQVAGKTWKNKPQTYSQAEPKLQWRNSQGEDICFIANSGGSKDHQISRINAVFLDWDCGRDELHNYFSDEIVRVQKDIFLPKLYAFAPAPSIIVETRNGFHAYWLMKPGVTSDQFRQCQRRLAVQFDGDGKVSNPARAMRLPGFDWVKPKSGCGRFNVVVLQAVDVRYGVDEVLAALPKDDGHLDGPKGRICPHNKCKCNTTLALIVGAKPATAATCFPSVTAAIDYLKQQDLGAYLSGVVGTPDHGQKIACPFHADSNPSAGVFRAKATGDWMFKCHACNVSGTILDMAMKVHGCDRAGAIKHLFDRFNIQIDTGWKNEQRDILQANLAVINDTGMFKDRYPCLYRLIGRIRGDLATKLRLAQDYLVSERSQVAGQAIFFSSLRHFHRVATGQTEHPRYSNRQNEKVDRYCLLGLMRKLPDAEVPPGLLQDAIRRRLKQGHKYRIQFFTFPAYTTELLDRANYRACRLIEAGVSVRGISSELIAGLFGDDVVCDVYPQIGDVQPSVAQVEFGAAVEQSLLSAVESKDYATIRQIRADMRRYDQWASVTARRIEKCLPAILIRLKLTKRTCDRQMKKSLGIGGSGYPKVIVRLDATKRGKIDESCE